MQIPGPSWADPRTPNVRSYSSVINACAKAGKAEEAVQWLERLEDAGLQSDAIVYSSVTLPSRWCLFWLSSIYTILYIILETDQFFFGGGHGEQIQGDWCLWKSRRYWDGAVHLQAHASQRYPTSRGDLFCAGPALCIQGALAGSGGPNRGTAALALPTFFWFKTSFLMGESPASTAAVQEKCVTPGFLTNPRRNRSALHEPNFGGNLPAPFRSDNSKDSNHETTVYHCISNLRIQHIEYPT